MIWCLTIPAILTALLALVALLAPAPRIKRPPPGKLLRGCAATMLLLIATLLAVLAMMLHEALL